MKLDLHEGSRLYSATGDHLGTIRQFVVQPSNSELAHVLVEKGVFFTNDRVVPLEAIERVEDDRVVLAEDVDPAALPRFVREDYTLVDDETRARLDAPTGTDYIWRNPNAIVGPFPLFPAYPMPPANAGRRGIDGPVTRDHLAEAEIIGPRTPVLSTKDEKLGTVAEMQVDESGRLSHLVVDLGLFDGEKVLPAHWIESMDSDGVRLAVGDAALETLETMT